MRVPLPHFLTAMMLFAIGSYCGALDAQWTLALLLYAVGFLIVAAWLRLVTCRVMKARMAFSPISQKVSELADRLQQILAPDGINVRPICKKSPYYFGTCRFLLQITMPVWNRNGNSCCQMASASANCSDIEPCANCNDVEPCAICLSDLEDSQRIRVLPCSHRFHAACADDWLKNSILCPLCKRSTGSDKRCTFNA